MRHKKSGDPSDHSGDREVSEAHSDDREVSETHCDDREVSDALSRGCKALQEAIQYRQRANIHFNSTRFVTNSKRQ